MTLTSGSTSIEFGAQTVPETITRLIERTEKGFDICIDPLAVILAIRFSKSKNALIHAAKDRGIVIRLITEINKENSEICKEISEGGIEVHHVNGIRSSFGVSDHEYFTFFSLQEANPPAETIYSNLPTVVEHHQYLFETLWHTSLSIEQRLLQLDSASEKHLEGETRIIKGVEEVSLFIISFLQRVKANPHELPFVCAVADKYSPALIDSLYWMVAETIQANPDFKGKFITDIQKENVEYVEKLMELGIETRHIDGIKAKFSFTNDEHIETSNSLAGGLPSEIIWSNSKFLISQSVQIFETLWEIAIPARARFNQLLEGTEQSVSKIVRGNEQITKVFNELLDEARSSILIALVSKSDNTATSNLLKRIFEKIEKEESKVDIRIISPHLNLSKPPGVQWQETDGTFLDLLVIDRKKAIIVSRSDISSDDSVVYQSSLGILSGHEATVRAVASFFNALFEEASSRTKEAQIRRQSELVQDILTHDMRNYIQIAQLGADLLIRQVDSMEESSATRMIKNLAQSIVSSIRDSSDLINRTTKLGKIFKSDPELHSVNILNSLERSLAVVRKMCVDRAIVVTMEIIPSNLAREEIQGTADELLDEAFVNVLSNAVQYTKGPQVPIEISVKDADDHWSISISDNGIGVAKDFQETRAFSRYLLGAKGTGLGLSIVHVLITERYGGRVSLAPRQDNTPGTRVEFCLKKWDRSIELQENKIQLKEIS